MNLYYLDYLMDAGSKVSVSLLAHNKVEAVAKGFAKLGGWREKDRVVGVTITEDIGNRELTAEDYMYRRGKHG